MTTLATAIGRGTNAARPAAGFPGRLYYDTTNSQLTRDNGTTWDVVEGAGGMTNPMTTAGDIITGGTAGAAQRLAVGSASQVLTVVSGAPAWAAPAAGSGTSPFTLDAITLDSTYGDDFDGTSLNARWTRQGIGADTEQFGIGASWMRTPLAGAAVTANGDYYYQTPASMPTYMELIWSGFFEAAGNDKHAAGLLFVDSSGGGLACGLNANDTAGDAFGLRSITAGIADTAGVPSYIPRGSIGAALALGTKQWLRLIRVAGDGITLMLAQYSTDGNVWSDFVSNTTPATVTRIGFGRWKSAIADAPQVLGSDRFNAIPLTLGTNLCHTPTSGTLTATASSSFSGFSPSSAFDGNDATDWASNGYATGQYIQGVWSVAQTINTVVLRGRNSTSDKWGYGYVEFSDGTRVPTGFMREAGSPNDTVVIRLASAKSTTLIKVVSVSGGGTNPGFREIQAFNAT